MTGDPSTNSDTWARRVPLSTWSVSDTAWLVGAAVATPDERATAMPAANAVAYVKWSSMHTSDAVLQALELGQLLLVVRRAAPDATAKAPPRRERTERAPKVAARPGRRRVAAAR